MLKALIIQILRIGVGVPQYDCESLVVLALQYSADRGARSGISGLDRGPREEDELFTARGKRKVHENLHQVFDLKNILCILY